MDKDIKQIIENIEVPLDQLDRAIHKGIEQSQVRPRKRKKSIMLGAVAMLGIILCSGFVSPKIGAVLADVPLIGFMYKIEKHDPGLHIAMMDDNKIALNKILESNEVLITIEDIVYDGTRLAFTYHQDEYDEIYPLNIKVDGEVINFSESLHELESENGFRGLIEIFPEEGLPDSFDLEVMIHQIGDTKGKWAINTFIEKVRNNSQQLESGQKGTINDLPFTVVQAEKSDTGVTIKVEFKASLDELFSKYSAIGVTITDQNGVPIKLDKKGSGNEEGMIYQYLLAPLSKSVTELQLSHYFMQMAVEREEIKVKLKEKLPQVISQGEMGDIVITSVQKSGQEYIMTFHSTSEFPFGVDFIPNVLDVLDHEGNSLITEYPIGIGRNEFELKFQISSGEIWLQTYELPKMYVEKTAKTVIPIK